MQAKNRLTQPSKNQTTDLSVTIGYKLSRQTTIKSKFQIKIYTIQNFIVSVSVGIPSFFSVRSPLWVLDPKVRMSWSLASVIIIIIFGQETNLCYVASASHSHAVSPMWQELLSLQLRCPEQPERNRILRAKAKLAGRQRTIPISRQKKDWKRVQKMASFFDVHYFIHSDKGTCWTHKRLKIC